MKPLKIKCSTTDCPIDLHWFRKNAQNNEGKAYGPCNDCGAERINWEQPHARRIEEAETIICQLQFEYIRHHYWHLPLEQKAINAALRKGRAGLAAKVA